MITPYNHQLKIWHDDPKWCLLALGTGSGKTLTALCLAQGETLVIAPKQQVLDETWQNNLVKLEKQLPLTVISKETFRRDWDKLPYYPTLIADECHYMLGVTADTRMKNGGQIPRTSQMFDALYHYVEKWNPERFYLLSATPASKPMNVWAIGILLKKDWNFFNFREKYYIQRKMGHRSIWLPKGTELLRQKLADLIKSFGYTGQLSDWFDVPEQTHKTVYFELTPKQKEVMKYLDETVADPMARRSYQRTVENGLLYDDMLVESPSGDHMVHRTNIFANQKDEYILERAEEFKKLLIFANYTGQIIHLEEMLKREGYTVYTLTGATKDRSSIIKNAEASAACIVIAQCGISSGYQLKSVHCVLFASKSYLCRDYIQGIGRVLRSDALKKNLYIHLVLKGGVDEDCHKAILSGMDFQEKIMS